PSVTLPTTPATSGSVERTLPSTFAESALGSPARALRVYTPTGTVAEPLATVTPGFSRPESEASFPPLARPAITSRLPANTTGFSTRPFWNSWSGSLVLAEANTSGFTPCWICAASWSEQANEERTVASGNCCAYWVKASLSDAAADTTRSGLPPLDEPPPDPQPAAASAAIATVTVINFRALKLRSSRSSPTSPSRPPWPARRAPDRVPQPHRA